MKVVQRSSRLVSLLFVLLSLSYAVIDGSYLWRGSLGVQTFGLIFFGLAVLVLFVWRILSQRARMPRSGLGWIFALGGVVVLLSLAFSADPRQSLWRVTWLAGYVVIFYFFLDGFDSGWLDRSAALSALLVVSGAVMALALLETYVWYQDWFTAIGGFELPPYQYRFASVFGYSNVLMSLANLAAPLALLTFFKGANRNRRVGAALWLILYAVVIPFSSSRGGWIGLGGWIAALVGVWVLERKPWLVLRSWSRRNLVLAACGAAIGVLALAAVGLRFWLTFSAHPSHGGDPFGGRSSLWAGAVELWKTSPWVGVGPGRYVMEYPRVVQRTPPFFWPYNAHGMYVQVLTEFGLAGIGVMLAGLAAGGWWLWQAYRSASSAHKPIARGLLAGTVGWLGQMIVDDFSGWITVMVPVIMMAAWLGTARQEPLARRKHLSFGWLWVAVLALLGFSAWDLWTFQPMGAALQSERQGDWIAAAHTMELAAQRDPALSLYATEAGLAWGMVYRETGNPQALSEARAWLQSSSEHEPQFSLLRANLGVLEWQAGERERAVDTMIQAAEQAPFEASYALNLGWMLEESGQEQDAVIWYRRALELAPRLSQHIFWTLSSARQQARTAWEPVADLKAPVYLPQVGQALADGDLTQAKRLLALARATNEDGSQVNYWRGRIAESEGDPERAIQSYLSVRAGLEMPIFWTTSNFSFGYTRWGYNRPGFLVDLVPGFGQLVGSEETWDGMKRLHAMQVQQSDCDEAAHTWEVWQKAESGGFPIKVPPPPVCP